MKTTLFVLSLFLLMTGHSYAGEDMVTFSDLGQELDLVLHDDGGNLRAPHEDILTPEYQAIMNGENPLEVAIPTESFEDFVAKSKIFDQDRISGKDVSRAPAVLEDNSLASETTAR
jgi:hypothetical protein